MGFPLVVSFYTPEYESELPTFIESLKKWEMEHELTPIKNRGGWRANVGYKPEFLIKELKRHGRPVLFIDVDAIVEGPCDLLRDIEEDYDFAGRFTLQPKPYNRPGATQPYRGNRHFKTITSGTLWFNATDVALKFLNLWKKNECGQYLLGQLVLAETWHHDRPEELRTLRLPNPYCWQKGIEGEPEIRHTRGAQRHRGDAGGYDSFAWGTDGMRRRTGMRFIK